MEATHGDQKETESSAFWTVCTLPSIDTVFWRGALWRCQLENFDFGASILNTQIFQGVIKRRDGLVHIEKLKSYGGGQHREGFTLPKTHYFRPFFVTMLGVDLSLLIGCGFRRPHCLSHCLASRATPRDALCREGETHCLVTRGRTGSRTVRWGR